MAKFKVGDKARVIFSIRYPECVGRIVEILSPSVPHTFKLHKGIIRQNVHEIKFVDGLADPVPKDEDHDIKGNWLCPPEWMEPATTPPIKLEEEEREIA